MEERAEEGKLELTVENIEAMRSRLDSELQNIRPADERRTAYNGLIKEYEHMAEKHPDANIRAAAAAEAKYFTDMAKLIVDDSDNLNMIPAEFFGQDADARVIAADKERRDKILQN